MHILWSKLLSIPNQHLYFKTEELRSTFKTLFTKQSWALNSWSKSLDICTSYCLTYTLHDVLYCILLWHPFFLALMLPNSTKAIAEANHQIFTFHSPSLEPLSPPARHSLQFFPTSLAAVPSYPFANSSRCFWVCNPGAQSWSFFLSSFLKAGSTFPMLMIPLPKSSLLSCLTNSFIDFSSYIKDSLI